MMEYDVEYEYDDESDYIRFFGLWRVLRSFGTTYSLRSPAARITAEFESSLMVKVLAHPESRFSRYFLTVEIS
jgi:hypothetical protein